MNYNTRVIQSPSALVMDRELLNEVCRLHDHCFRQPPSCQEWLWEPDGNDPSRNSHAFFREAATLPGFFAVIATDPELGIIGTVAGAQLTEAKIAKLGFGSVGAQPGDGYEVVAFIHEKWKGSGLYRNLNLLRLTRFREQQIRQVYVRCRMDNAPVLGARRSLGYRVVAENIPVTIGGRTDLRAISCCDPEVALLQAHSHTHK